MTDNEAMYAAIAQRTLSTGGTADDVLVALRASGANIIDSIKILRAATGMSLGDAKAFVDRSVAWDDARLQNEHLRDLAEDAIHESEGGSVDE